MNPVQLNYISILCFNACFILARYTAESIDDDQPRVEKLSLKKKGIGSEARAERMAKADVDLQLFSEAEQGRLLQKQKKRRIQGREDEVYYVFVVILTFFTIYLFIFIVFGCRLCS